RAATGDFTAIEDAVVELTTGLLTTRHVSTGTVENVYRRALSRVSSDSSKASSRGSYRIDTERFQPPRPLFVGELGAAFGDYGCEQRSTMTCSRNRPPPVLLLLKRCV